MAISAEDQAYLNRLKQASINSKQSSNVFTKIGDWIGGLWNDFTGKTNNQMNLDFQRENLDYQKAIQQQIFEREDSAYQRTVNDMRAAGLNPVSMQGTNGSGEAVSTESMDSQKTSDVQALSEIINVLNQVSNTRNNASLSQAQSNLIEAQAQNQRIKNIWESDILSSTLEGIGLENVGKKFLNERSNIAWLNDQANLNFLTQYGLTDNMPDLVKMSALMSGEKVYNRDFIDFKKNIENYGLGKSYTSYTKANTSNFLSSQKLQGAIMENNILNGLLSLIPGLGKVLGR